jgi:hypothetical protein
VTPEEIVRALEDAKAWIERYERAKARALALRDQLLAHLMSEVEKQWGEIVRSGTEGPDGPRKPSDP